MEILKEKFFQWDYRLEGVLEEKGVLLVGKVKPEM